MRERGWGRIVNVGSSSTREPIPGLALSNSTVWQPSASSRRWPARSPPRASRSTRSPPAASRPSAWPRVGSLVVLKQARPRACPAAASAPPEEYGDLVAFLCSERAAYLTGAVIPLDGGLLRSA